MDMASDILGSGRNITGDRLYTAIETAEELFSNNITYVGTCMTNRKGLPSAVRNKTVRKDKSRVPCSSKFAWKVDSPVMAVSYVPKPGRNVIILSTAHNEQEVMDDSKKKPICIDFYNSQRCGLDIVNEMLKDYCSQPTCNNWPLVVSSFIIDLSALNGATIFSYNCPEKYDTRRNYVNNLALQLVTAHLVRRLAIPGLQSPCISAIKTVLTDDSIQPPIDPRILNGRQPVEPARIDPNPGKCDNCVKDLANLRDDVERRRRKHNLNPQKKNCDICKKPVCPRHIKKYICTLCENLS